MEGTENMTTKAQMKEIIRSALEVDTTFGNDFVNMADAWADACTKQLNSMTKNELQVWVERATTVRNKWVCRGGSL